MALLLITFFSACIESDDITGVVDPPGQIQPEPEPTLVGFPIGIPTTKTVGANGGSISDASEVITVDIPAGALHQDTDITIQPATNLHPMAMVMHIC